MGGVYQISLLLIWMYFIIWAWHPTAALERCRAVPWVSACLSGAGGACSWC